MVAKCAIDIMRATRRKGARNSPISDAAYRVPLPESAIEIPILAEP